MGVLAACAFSFLAFLVFRRPAAHDEDDHADAYAALKAEADAVLKKAPDAPVVVTAVTASHDDGLASFDSMEPTEEVDLHSSDGNGREAADAETDWFVSDGTQDFADFDPEQDDLVVVWDDSDGAEPHVQVRRSEDDPELGHILMDDVIVAQFRTRAEVDHYQVALVPFSRARHLGWARA